MADGKDDAVPRGEENRLSRPPPSAAKPVTVDDDSDPDFDDLDGMSAYNIRPNQFTYLVSAFQMSSINSPLLMIDLSHKPMSNHNSPRPPRLDQADPHLLGRPPLYPLPR
jgi:hypothetical protein